MRRACYCACGATAQTMQTSASAGARRVRRAARTPRAWRQWSCDARAVRAARAHGWCVTGKDIAPVAELDAAARQQQCDEQCSNHICCTAGAWLLDICTPIVGACDQGEGKAISATARSDHWRAGSIVYMPKAAIAGAFRERPGVLVPYRTLAFLLPRSRCFCSHFSRKLVICASNPPRVLLSTS